jgi:hypothetical protein
MILAEGVVQAIALQPNRLRFNPNGVVKYVCALHNLKLCVYDEEFSRALPFRSNFY